MNLVMLNAQGHRPEKINTIFRLEDTGVKTVTANGGHQGMNDEHGYQGPGQHNPENKISSPVQTALGIGCLGCLGLIIIVAGVMGWVYYHGKTTLSPMAADFIRLAESGEYDAAYEELGQGWKNEQSLDQFKDYYTNYIKALGNRRSLKFFKSQENVTTTDGRTAVVSFKATYEKGNATLVVSMKKYDDQWRVIGCKYASPFFSKLLACSECGNRQKALTKFCSNCGALMPVEKHEDEPVD